MRWCLHSRPRQPTAKRLGFIYSAERRGHDFHGHRLLDAEGTRAASFELSPILDAARAVSRPGYRDQRPRRRSNAEATPRTTPAATTRKPARRWLTGARAKRTEGCRRRDRSVRRSARCRPCSASRPCCRRSSCRSISACSPECATAPTAAYISTLCRGARRPSPLPTENNPRARLRAACSATAEPTRSVRRSRARTAASSTSSAPISRASTQSLGPADRVHVDEYLDFRARSRAAGFRRSSSVGDQAGLPALGAAARHPGTVRRARQAHVRAAMRSRSRRT